MHDQMEVVEYLKKAGTYFLATCEEGQPHVRPFGTVNWYKGRLYIQSGKRKPVAAQIARNPKVELCANIGGTWLRLTGTLVEDPSLEAQQSLLDAYPSLGGMYKAGDGNTVVYYFTDATANFSSFTAPPYSVRL